MVDHQAPPFPIEGNEGEGNELILEETDHDLARHTLAAQEVGEGRVPTDLLDHLLKTTPSSSGIPDEMNLGWLLTQCLRSDEAINRIAKDQENDPLNNELRRFAAVSLQRIGDFNTSKKILSELLEDSPNDLVLRRYYANALMSLGEWQDGLMELELSRGELAPLQKDFCEDISRLWIDQDLAGKHIVVVSNGRQSDQIQFARYINQLIKLRPSKIGFVCDEEMVVLMRTLDEINRVDSELFEPFDYFIPVESLPLRLEATPEDIQQVPYLVANEHRVEGKLSKLKAEKPLLGLNWRNFQPEGADESDVSYRQKAESFDLEPFEWHLRELALAYDIIAFQPDITEEERKILSECGCGVLEATEFNDFSVVAEWLACMDTVISVDSPISHLAGALGLEGHVMLPYTPSWKWGVENGQSKWYPTLQVHQKNSEDCWRQTVEALFSDLSIPTLPVEIPKAS